LIVFAGVCILLSGVILFAILKSRQGQRRMAFIRQFDFPPGLTAKVSLQHPHLTPSDLDQVTQGLRQFFLAYHLCNHQYIAMPSRVVDDLWHEFILYTQSYADFCKRAFGRFLHHTPAVMLGSQRKANAGLRRVWYRACQQESINPRTPLTLPLLFALDATLAISDGFVYAADCRGIQRADGTGIINCAIDFADSSSGGDVSSCGGDSSSDSSGCNGGCNGGCSGGCGGGGGD